ncbi:MAG: BatD family protein [Chitinispirillales bacterium]|jgi:hypothetical protein|nr:BatD family protein [Chitinispirillales bacterium]
MNIQKITITIISLLINFVLAVEVKSFKMTTNNTNIQNGDIVSIMAELLTDAAVSTDIPQFPQSSDYSVLSVNKSQSSSTSISMINGKTTSDKTVTTRFLYQIQFNTQKSSINLAPLLVIIENRQVASNGITFQIGEKKEEDSPVSVKFLRERSTIYKGEQARLTVRVMVRSNTNAQLTNDGYVGFLKILQDKLSQNFTLTPLSNSPENKHEVINGVSHQVYDLVFNLVPLDTGKITIPSISIVYIIQERGGGRDPFDGFFGFSSIRQKQAAAISPALTYNISDLPKPMPKNFTGIIGAVKLSGSLSRDSVPAGESITLNITMSGKMSSALMGDIELDKNPDLDIFPPERKISQDTTSTGVNTKKQYSWMIIPKKEGTFKIPGKEIIWFDPNSAAYKTASTGNFTIKASAGNYSQQTQTKRYLTQSEITTFGNDIRYIKTNLSENNANQNEIDKKLLLGLFSSAWILSLFLILIKLKTILFPKNINEEKKSRAFSTAVRELNRILNGKENISPMAAIIKYLSAKTSKETGSMKYDEIEKLLESRSVSANVREKLTKYFRDVEISRYASGNSQNNLAKNGIDLLKSIEKEFK